MATTSNAVIFNDGKFQGIDNEGNVVSMGTLWITECCTGKPVATFTDSKLTSQNEYPIRLSASGKADVYLLDGEYDITLRDSDGVEIWSITNFIPACGSGGDITPSYIIDCREEFTGIDGDTLSLGCSILGSPVVHKNGLLLESSEYSYTGDTITFSTPLVSSDVIIVMFPALKHGVAHEVEGYVEYLDDLRGVDITKITSCMVKQRDAANNKGGGAFYYTPNNIDEDNGVYIASDFGGTWVRIFSGDVHTEWYPDEKRETIAEIKNNHGTYIVDSGAKNTNSFFFGVCFESNEDARLKFIASYNGLSYTPVFQADIEGRDPSIIEIDGRFLISTTGYALGSHDFVIYETFDFVNFNKYLCKLGGGVLGGTAPDGGTVTVDKIWAPDLIYFNDELYVTISIQYAPDEEDIEGTLVPVFRNYISKCTNINDLSFETPAKIKYTEEKNMIDPEMFFHGTTMYYAHKDEYSKRIEFFKGTDPISVFQKVGESSIQWVEGPSLIESNGNIYCVCDAFRGNGKMVIIDTENYTKFDKVLPFYSEVKFRHGSIIKISDRDILNKINDLRVGGGGYSSEVTFYTKLKSGSNDIYPIEGECFYIDGSDVAHINIMRNDVQHFYIYIGSQAKGAAIFINGNENFIPVMDSDSNFIGYGTHLDQFIELYKGVDGKYKISLNENIDKEYSGLPDGDYNDGTEDFTPAKNYSYFVHGSDIATIHNLPSFLPIGHQFTVKIATGANGGVILKGNITISGSDQSFFGDQGYENKILLIRKILNNKWGVFVSE